MHLLHQVLLLSRQFDRLPQVDVPRSVELTVPVRGGNRSRLPINLCLIVEDDVPGFPGKDEVQTLTRLSLDILRIFPALTLGLQSSDRLLLLVDIIAQCADP